MAWKLSCDPDGANTDDRNEGAMVVYLTDGSRREEISRVGFVRRNSANPELPFEQALAREIEKGKAALRAKRELEEYMAGAGALR